MNTLLISVGVFLNAVALHVILHRMLLHRGVRKFACTLTYVMGAGVLGIYLLLTPRLASDTPLTAMTVYLLASLLISYEYLTIFMAGETPASAMLESFAKKKRQTRREILSHFTDKGLLHDRIVQLTQTGLIVSRSGRLYATPLGRVGGLALTLYQRVFHRSLRG